MASPDDFIAPDRPAVADGRLGRIVGAYLLACVAAAVTRTVGLLTQESLTRGLGRLIGENGVGALILVPIASTLVIFVAASPFATACLMVAETRRWRSPVAYLVGGAVVGPATQILVAVLGGSTSVPSGGLLALAAFAGLIGGWVHWLVAIRSAPPPPRPLPDLPVDLGDDPQSDR